MSNNRLITLINKNSKFLTNYANGIYGGKLTHAQVKKFLDKANVEDLEEIESYNTLNLRNEMKNDQQGAGDLEDYIKFVIKRDNK